MAFKAIKLRQPQLILLDVFLSNNYDGLDLCKRLKSSTYSKGIPVIIISCFCEIAQSAINEYGAEDFIAKPIEFKSMMLKINSALLKNRAKE